MRLSLVPLLISLTVPAFGAGPLGRPAGPSVQRSAAVPGDQEIREIRRSVDELRALSSRMRSLQLADQIRLELAQIEVNLAHIDVVRWDLIDIATALEAEALTCAQVQERRRPMAQPPHHYREPWYPSPPQVEVVQPGPLLTTPQDMSRIAAALDEASFSKEKLAALRSASRDRAFTCAQVVRLLESFSFGSDKVEAAAMLYPTVVDPQDWYTVYGALDFDSDRRKLRERVGD